MKSLLFLSLVLTSSMAYADERAASYAEKVKFCKAIDAYFKEQSQGEDVRLALSVPLCRLGQVQVYPQSEAQLDLEARVIVWIGGIPFPVTCMAEMQNGEIVADSPDCTY